MDKVMSKIVSKGQSCQNIWLAFFMVLFSTQSWTIQLLCLNFQILSCLCAFMFVESCFMLPFGHIVFVESCLFLNPSMFSRVMCSHFYVIFS